MTSETEGGLPTVRLKGWNTLAQWTRRRLGVATTRAQGVIREYMERHGRPDIIAAQSATWAGHAAWQAHRRWGCLTSITEVNTEFGTGSCQRLRRRQPVDAHLRAPRR